LLLALGLTVFVAAWLTLKRVFLEDRIYREKIYALEAFIYKALRASKKVGLDLGCKVSFFCFIECVFFILSFGQYKLHPFIVWAI